MPDSLVSLTVTTAAFLAGALLADKLLERRVSAAARVFLFLAVIIRPALPVASPLGVLTVQAPPLLVAAPGPSTPRSFPWWRVIHGGVALVLLARWAGARQTLARQLRGVRTIELHPRHRVVLHPTLGPLACGLFRPLIVIPRSLGPERLKFVLDHEAAHLDRGDQRLLVAVQLACIVAWPLIPVWLAAARVRTLVELAADERALAGRPTEERRRYGEALVALAQPGPAVWPAFGAGLRGRLRALAFRRRWPAIVQGGLVATLVVATAAACAPGPEGAPPSASHRADPGEVAVIKQHQPELRACYERWLDRSPRQSLMAIVGIALRSDGRVDGVRMLRGDDEGGLNLCLVKTVSGWVFPPPAGAHRMITLPLMLQGGAS